MGKTTLALQLAVNTTHAPSRQNRVIWIDTGSPFVYQRLESLIQAWQPTQDQESSPTLASPLTREQVLGKISHILIQNLPQLLTLFLHPSPGFPPAETGLVVIDDISRLITGAFLPSQSRRSTASQNEARDRTPTKAASRKWNIVADLAGALSKTAALKGLAIVVINQTSMTFDERRKAVLKPTLSHRAWDEHIFDRIKLYRQATHPALLQELSSKGFQGLRFAQVVKASARIVGMQRTPVPFTLERVRKPARQYRLLRKLILDQGGIREFSISGLANLNGSRPTEAQNHALIPDRAANDDDNELASSRHAADPVERKPDSPSNLNEEDEMLLNEQSEAAIMMNRSALPAASLPSSPPIIRTGSSKRKAVEIADSEEDEEDSPLVRSRPDDGISLSPAREEPRLRSDAAGNGHSAADSGPDHQLPNAFADVTTSSESALTPLTPSDCSPEPC